MADHSVTLGLIRALETDERRYIRWQSVFRPSLDDFDLHQDHFPSLFRLSKDLVKLLIDKL